jgi:hypothetical protein
MNYTEISAAVDPQQDMSRPARLQVRCAQRLAATHAGAADGEEY